MSEEKLKKENIPGSHEKISYTAIGVAYARSFSDIPYSKEISDICDASNLTEENRQLHEKLAPHFEARFKSLTNLLRESGIKNILEVASGIGPRGLLMTEDPSIQYLESDLPDMLRQKKGLLATLATKKGMSLPENLHFTELNALDEESFRAAVAKLAPGSIAIGNEGLLPYFTRGEKQKMAEIVRKILIERGGVWITTDIYTQADTAGMKSGENSDTALDELKTRTGRDHDANAFTDVEDAQKFFTDLGFDFTIRTLKETAGELASAHIGLNPESIERQTRTKIWELRARS